MHSEDLLTPTQAWYSNKEEHLIDGLLDFIPIVSDEESIQEIIWGLAFYLEKENESQGKVSKLIERKAFRFVIKGLKFKSQQAIRPILRILMHATCSSIPEALEIFDYDLLKSIAALLAFDKAAWAHDICVIFSNLIESPGYGFCEKLFEPAVINSIIKWMTDGRNQSVIKTAVWVIGAVIKKGTSGQVEKLIVDFNVIEVLLFVMRSNTENVVKEVLRCLESLLEFSSEYALDETNPVAARMERCEHFGFFTELQTVQSTEIYQKVSHLIAKYFHGVIEDER